MRRVIENHINEILDILYEQAKSDRPDLIDNIEAAKTRRFSEKLDCASELFPKSITPPNNPNPLEPLYKLTSEAVHSLSEDEAVEIFDQCRVVFEYVFSELRPHLKANKNFVQALQAIALRSAKGQSTADSS
jgi:hypothetical protein